MSLGLRALSGDLASTGVLADYGTLHDFAKG
mgnify:CR=1 FL=1